MSNLKNYKSIPTHRLIKADWNYKQDDPDIHTKLKANIRKNGQIENLIVRLIDDKYEVVNGNHRLDVLVELKIKEAICYDLGEIPDHLAKRIAIETNETRFISDEGKLHALLGELLKEYNTDDLLESLPYTQSDLEEMNIDYPSVKEEIEDQIPEVENVPVVKTGELWILGKHRLLCADSTKEADMQRLMDGEKADMLFSDPPYNVGYEYNAHDDTDNETYKKLIKALFKQRENIGKMIVTPGRQNLYGFQSIEKPKHIGIWITTNAMTHGKITHFSVWEPILFYGDYKKKRGNDLFEYPIGNQKDTGNHTCPKPFKLWIDLIEHFSDKNQLIFDPFLGSGTTIIACEKINRICYGIEIDPWYCTIILQRYFDYTGADPVNESGESYLKRKNLTK